MMRSAKVHLLLASVSAVVITLFTWTVATAYLTCCHWPNHNEKYTFDPSVPNSFYTAINAGALTWTISPASTWGWINWPTPGRLIKYMSIDGPNDRVADTTVSWNPTTLVISFMEMRFDTAENWYTGSGTPGSGQYDLQSIATHEFGHALGLKHTNASCPANTVTNPTMCAGYGVLSTYGRTLEPDDTSGLQNLYPPLVQWYWRGTEGRRRQVPIVNGVPDFTQAEPWSAAVNQSTLPGSGNVQGLAYVPIGGTLYQELWQSNTRWTRTIPIVGGIVQEGSATAWQSGLTNFGTMPGSGTVQDNNFYVLCTTLYHQFWRGDQGWYRSIPISGGVPNWGSATAWAGPVALSALPGSGSLQGYSDYTTGTFLGQAVWQNNLGYARTVPISGCTVNFGSPGAWSGAISINSLPGSGNMQATDNYELIQ